jgi:hypothetical protein
MNHDARDLIWQYTYELYYDCYFEELLMYYLSGRWIKVDIVARILMAVTASGSTISGWTLWQQPNFKTAWAIIAGFTALLAITYMTLNVTEKVKLHTQSYKDFFGLRQKLQQFRNDLGIDPNFQIEEMNSQLKTFGDIYSSICSQSAYDILNTKKLKKTTQVEINHKLSDIIQKEG